MSRNLCNVSRFDRHIFTLNLTIERKTLEHAKWCPFVVHTQYISLVSIPWLHQCTHAWSTPRSAPRSSCRTKRQLPSPNHFNYKYLLICLAQCLGTTDWNLIRPPPNFRRVCKISKSGHAPIGFVMSAFLYVCLYIRIGWNIVKFCNGTCTKNLQRRMNLVTAEQKKKTFMWRLACVNDYFKLPSLPSISIDNDK